MNLRKHRLLGLAVSATVLLYTAIPGSAQAGGFQVGDRVKTTDYNDSSTIGTIVEVCGPPLSGCYKVHYDYQPAGNSNLIRFDPEHADKFYKVDADGNRITNAPVTTRNQNPTPAVANRPADAGRGPIGEPALHDAPRGPTPAPPNAGANPSADFFKKLIMAKQEMNAGGRTNIMDIHSFSVGAPRNATWNETAPRAAGAMVTPILVRWTQQSYGQTDRWVQEQQATWLVWRNENGVWEASTTGDVKMLGPLKTTDHPSIP